MDIELSSPPPSAITKALLLEAIGKPLLAYLLNLTEDEAEQWLNGSSNELDSEEQTHALQQLVAVLQNVPISGEPAFRRFDLARIFGQYFEPFSTTIANAVRIIATGQGSVADIDADASIQEILTKLTQDAYPLFLLPDSGDNFPPSPASLYNHPARLRFESAVLDDPQLSRLFPNSSEHSGRTGNVLRSTGHGGSIQLALFAETIISGGWRMAEMSSPAPTVDEHVKATLIQLDTVRRALEGQTVTVPVRIGFTGILFNSTCARDLGWGVLRRTDDRERKLAPKGLEGQVAGSRSDGTLVTVNYSGDVVLETTVEYRILLQEFDPELEWPERLRIFDRVSELIESIQLGALLSEEYDTVEPITVLPTWHYVHDPLSIGYNIAWNDPRLARAFIPKQLNEAEEAEWCKFAAAVQKYRTKYIDVALRRTLRASAERKEFSDVLVDTVIAWENLVGSQQGEPTLRVSSSLARLLEGEFKARKKLRTEVAGIYSTRSDIVHGNKQPDARELIKKSHRALELTIRALRALFAERLDLLKDCKGGDERSIAILME